MSEEARQQVTLLGAETARLQAQVTGLQRAVSTNIPVEQTEHHLYNSQQNRTSKQERNKTNSEPFTSSQQTAMSHSLTLGHYSSHAKTPSVSSSDTESILMSEVEFKVLPSHSSHSNNSIKK